MHFPRANDHPHSSLQSRAHGIRRHGSEVGAEVGLVVTRGTVGREVGLKVVRVGPGVGPGEGDKERATLGANV